MSENGNGTFKLNGATMKILGWVIIGVASFVAIQQTVLDLKPRMAKAECEIVDLKIADAKKGEKIDQILQIVTEIKEEVKKR